METQETQDEERILPDHRHADWIGLPKMLTVRRMDEMAGDEKHHIAEGETQERVIQHRRTGKKYRASVTYQAAALVIKLLGKA